MAKIILDKRDMTYLSWSKIRNSSGTAGSFLKSYEEVSGKKIYYKLSDFDTVNGITGHECVNEIIADRLLTVLGIEHLEYSLIHADVLINNKLYETYLCASEDFKQKGEEKMALDIYYEQYKEEGESPIDFCIRNGFAAYIYEMMLVDFLILNRDRHGANIEVLRNPKTKTTRLAPLFDHGISLLSRCRTDAETEAYDISEDKRIQSFVGSHSAYENLKMIPESDYPGVNELKPSDREYIIKDLDKILPENLINKIWDMIWTRWCIYEDIRNKKR